MTPDEKENMTLTIENAMLKGFERIAITMKKEITDAVETHTKTCRIFSAAGSPLSVNIASAIKDWRTIFAGLTGLALIIFALVNAFSATPKFTPEQVRQIAVQVQEVTNPTTITKEK